MTVTVNSPYHQSSTHKRTQTEILEAVYKLIDYHKQGLLGGERMPEASNPGLDPASRDHFHYFTLPMSLNYRRSSYQMWEGALATYQDQTTRFVFMPEEVVKMPESVLREALLRYKLALQPVQHIATWRKICETLVQHYKSDVRHLFAINSYDIALILNEVRNVRKDGFPRLRGNKIGNYWLYVMSQYAEPKLINRQHLSVAPDTHVMKASIVLGLVEPISNLSLLPSIVADAWRELLACTDLCPIDMHYPLWLWSRKNFMPTVFDDQEAVSQLTLL